MAKPAWKRMKLSAADRRRLDSYNTPVVASPQSDGTPYVDPFPDIESSDEPDLAVGRQTSWPVKGGKTDA